MRFIKTLNLVFGFLFLGIQAYGFDNPCPQQATGIPYNYKKGSFTTGVVDKSFVQKIFSRIQDPKLNLSSDYVVDGCDMRAYLISKHLKESNNLNTFRVALETKSSTGLVIKTNKTHEGLVEFSRHTATAICVLNPTTNTIEPYVLDPVFFSSPVRLDQWSEKISGETDPKINLYFSSMYSLNPQVSRTKFHKGEVEEALRLQKLFAEALRKHKERGTKPYGIGRGRENVREFGLDSTTE
jgi:hypothetical protein